METATVIDELYRENRALLEFLSTRGEISLLSHADDSLRRSLLLSAASYFESLVKDCVARFVADHSNGVEPISELVRRKVIDRQYHTFFDWDDRSAGKFFAMFGDGFKDFMRNQVRSDEDLKGSIAAFVELGQLRNCLVHQNYATFSLEKTAEEIYRLYRQALGFVDVLPNKMRDYVSLCVAPAGSR